MSIGDAGHWALLSLVWASSIPGGLAAAHGISLEPCTQYHMVFWIFVCSQAYTDHPQTNTDCFTKALLCMAP